MEVQKKGVRARGRFDTHQEAQAAEKLWKSDITQANAVKKRVDLRGAPTTLSALALKSRSSLFVGQASELQSLQRLQKAIRIIGDMSLEKVSTVSLDALVVTLRNGGGGATIAPSTINRYLSSLHSLLVWGNERGYVAQVPKFPWQREMSGRVRWLSVSEEQEMLKRLSAYGRVDLANLVSVAIATGMRRGEILGLVEKDVEPSWVRLWKTKTDTPRSVPIAPETHGKLLTLLKGGMPAEHELRYWWDKVKQDMGLAHDPWFVFHACRHTCATRLVQANVNIRVIQRFLGHKRIETTMRYAQVDDQMLTDALGQMVPQVSHSHQRTTRDHFISRTAPPPATIVQFKDFQAIEEPQKTGK